MFFWFVGTAIASVWFIFRDPQFNYRYLIVGAVLPDTVELWFGKAGPLHSIVTSVVLLSVVMVATIGARPRRKRWLAGVIGVFMHLVFDGAFLNTKIFWWPLSGLSFSGAPVPSVSRGWWNAPMEIAGVAMILWWAHAHSHPPRQDRGQ
jgi:hypothetical protein